ARRDDAPLGVDVLAPAAELRPDRRDFAVAHSDIRAEHVGGGCYRAVAHDEVEIGHEIACSWRARTDATPPRAGADRRVRRGGAQGAQSAGRVRRDRPRRAWGLARAPRPRASLRVASRCPSARQAQTRAAAHGAPAAGKCRTGLRLLRRARPATVTIPTPASPDRQTRS